MRQRTKDNGNLLQDTIRRLLTAWLLGAVVEYILLAGDNRTLEGMGGIAEMSFMRMMIVIICSFVLLTIIVPRILNREQERWLLPGIFIVLAGVSLMDSFSWLYLGACCGVLLIMILYCLKGWDSSDIAVTEKTEKNGICLWTTAVLALVFFLFVSIWTVSRIYSFRTPTYDFTIFAQMFHNMRTAGLPVTTVERDGLLSHFKVHVSPIFYLLLPFYCLVPDPATLQVLQAAVLASAVIPLWKLAKHHGLTPVQRTILCGLLLLHPAFAGGAAFDIHENAFLTPLLLWTFYGIERENRAVTILAAVLTLMVKEDAAVYVAVIGLWLLVRSLLRRKKWGINAGTVLFLAAVFWFLLVTGYLAECGDGVMTNRYKNFMTVRSGSLWMVIRTVLLCPMKVIYECVDREKISYIMLTLLPVLGLPFWTRKYENYILIIPYILVNLMSDYTYQHNIFFQYSFGSTACLIYLALIHLSGWNRKTLRSCVLLAAAGVSLVCFSMTVMPKAVQYPVEYINNREQYEEIRAVLEQIPDDASVAASGFYTAALSQRSVLYDVHYASKEHLLSCQYVVLDPYSDYRAYNTKEQNGFRNLEDLLISNGYQQQEKLHDRVLIYKRAD